MCMGRLIKNSLPPTRLWRKGKHKQNKQIVITVIRIRVMKFFQYLSSFVQEILFRIQFLFRSFPTRYKRQPLLLYKT